MVGTAQIRLNRRTGGQLMLRGRVILGCNSGTEGSLTIEDQPHLNWILQLPGIFFNINQVTDLKIVDILSYKIRFNFSLRITYILNK